MSNNVGVAEWAERILGVEFQDAVAIADRLWLRKEIVREDLYYGKDL